MGKGGCTAKDAGTASTRGSNRDNDCSTISNANANGNGNSNAKITASVLASKTTIKECWIAYEGNVYDVTHWLAKHPGGIRTIMTASGQDATSVMKSMHTPEVLMSQMKRLRKVGVLIPDEPPRGQESEEQQQLFLLQQAQKQRNDMITKDFHDLNQKLEEEGWYKAMPFHYWAAVLRVIILATVGVALILNSQSDKTASTASYFLQLVLGSMMIGFFFQNIAFMGHDAGHGSISASFNTDLWMGLILGNLLTGIDVSWWKSTHYVHHSATNSVHDDPDIQHMPLLCFEERLADNPWSKYHGRFQPFDAVARICVPYQAWYFYPVMAVARINLYISSIIYLVQTCPYGRHTSNQEKAPSPAAQAGLVNPATGKVMEKYAWPKPTWMLWLSGVATLAVFWTTMVRFLICLDVYSGVMCFTVMHFTAGILHVQILCSHVAMDYCTNGSGSIGANASFARGESTQDNIATEQTSKGGIPPYVGFFEWQALSTMDIACPSYMDWFHGGLQFQLEHHLFPRAPRWRLRKLMPLVDEIFQKYDIPVTRATFIQANVMMLAQMAHVGDKLGKMMSKQKNL
jgi:fatty acid desaturase/predicted heme/steroid binding protein